MANPEHLKLLQQGVDVWNAVEGERAFRSALTSSGRTSPSRPQLGEPRRGEPQGANLFQANFSGSNLEAADPGDSTHAREPQRGEPRRGEASYANLSGADLTGAILHGAMLVRTNLANAILTGCRVYGISAWDVKVSEGTRQQDLVVTPLGEPEVTADDLEVAQFIYLLLNNEKLQRVIDTITSKVVLIIGRFSPERKMVLDALRDELRNRNYAPVVFDFEKPKSGTTIKPLRCLPAWRGL